MSSSRERDNGLEPAREGPGDAGPGDAPEESTPVRRCSWRTLLALLLVIVCVVAAGILWHRHRQHRLRLDRERRLGDARELLDQLWLEQNEETRQQRAQEARLMLRGYLEEDGQEPSPAKLLLGVSLIAQGRDQTPQENADILDLFGQVYPLECSTRDLLIATAFLLVSNRPAAADELVTAALNQGDQGELRPEVLRRAVNVRYYVGRDDDVLAHCRELTGLDPQDTYPLRVMASIYENQVKWDQLIDVDRKLMALAPPDAENIRHRLVETLITTGRADEARKQFETLSANAPELPASSPLTEARLLHVEGKIDEALVILQQVLAASPNDPKALLLKGRIELARSQPDDAIQALTRLIQIDPTANEAHYLLGQAYARAGDAEKAKHHLAEHRRVLDLRVKLYELERQANRNPADVDVRLEITELYAELGWPEKVQFWQQAAQSARAMRGY